MDGIWVRIVFIMKKCMTPETVFVIRPQHGTRMKKKFLQLIIQGVPIEKSQKEMAVALK